MSALVATSVSSSPSFPSASTKDVSKSSRNGHRVWKVVTDSEYEEWQVQKVGKGRTCKVYLLVGTERVFKVAKKSFDIATTLLQKEKENLVEIHGGKRVWGLQEEAYEISSVTVEQSKGKVEHSGVYHPYYSGRDYLQYLEKTPVGFTDAHLLQFHQLLHALSYLHTHHWLHGDIKLENIFPHGNKFHLGDFATACKTDVDIKEILAVASCNKRMASPEYTSHLDILEGRDLLLRKKREELIALAQAHDVFSLGVVLYRAIKRDFPYKFEGHYMKGSYIPFCGENIPPSITDLISRMCNLRAKNRPTAKEALTVLQEYLKNEKSAIYEQITIRIHEGGYSLDD